MIAIDLLFLGLPLAVLFAFLWATNNPAKLVLTPEEALDSLSKDRPLHRLPQLLKALDPADTEFLVDRGMSHFRKRITAERSQIALHYVDALENDFETLLEASRALAVMSPELNTMQELERLRLSLRFSLLCRILRLRLRLGISPWKGFGLASDMAGTLSLQLETAMSRIVNKSAGIP